MQQYKFSFLRNVILRCEFDGITEINTTIKRIEEVINDGNYIISKGTIESMEMTQSFSKRYLNDFEVDENSICYRFLNTVSLEEIYISEYFLEYSVRYDKIGFYNKNIELFIQLLFAIKNDNKFININYLLHRELYQTTSKKFEDINEFFNSDFFSVINENILGENQVQSIEKFISLNSEDFFCEITSAIDDVEINDGEIGMLITLDILSLKEVQTEELNPELVSSILDELRNKSIRIFKVAIKEKLVDLLEGKIENNYKLKLVSEDGKC